MHVWSDQADPMWMTGNEAKWVRSKSEIENVLTPKDIGDQLLPVKDRNITF